MLSFTLVNYSYWFIVAIAFLSLESFFLPGIGMLFIGLGCLSTGFLLTIESFKQISFLAQLSYCCGFTALWCLILWNYFKRNFFGKETDKQFGDLIGNEAQIYQNDLQKHKTGQIRWSGTILNGRIDDAEPDEIIPKDAIVIIKAVRGNVLLVRKK